MSIGPLPTILTFVARYSYHPPLKCYLIFTFLYIKQTQIDSHCPSHPMRTITSDRPWHGHNIPATFETGSARLAKATLELWTYYSSVTKMMKIRTNTTKVPCKSQWMVCNICVINHTELLYRKIFLGIYKLFVFGSLKGIWYSEAITTYSIEVIPTNATCVSD